MKIKTVLPFLVAFEFLFNAAFSQKIDSMMEVYAKVFPQEKAHLHFDKDVYRKGETIWYKVYLMLDGQQSYQSKNFFADWYDDNGKLLLHTVAPIYQSSTRGQFEIPADYSGNSIHLKAYTKWMLNFDSSFVFERNIKIEQSVPPSSKSKNREKPATTIHFFPEGGDCIDGVESKMAFLVANQYGKPVQANGAILNTKGEFVDSFTTSHDGMGVLNLTPRLDVPLVAIWSDAYGNRYNTPLPLPKLSGIVLEVLPTKNKTLFALQYRKSATSKPEGHVIAHINQHLVYMSKVNFKEDYVSGQIPTSDLPTGIMQITVFDADWKPVAERVVFVDNGLPSFSPSLEIDTKGLDKREKNVFEIKVDDSIKSNMSIAITDADWYHDSSTNIFSQLLLSDEIKGVVNNPAYYFSSNDDSVKQHLDLVMLTHGWRRFNWTDLQKGILPKLRYERDSDYLEIKGKVFGHAFARRDAKSINLILATSDNTRKLISLPVDKHGEFLQRGVLFFDTVKAYYQFNGDKRLTDIATVNITNGLYDDYPKRLNPSYQFPFVLPDYLADTANLLQTRSLLAQIDRAEKRLKAHQLAEVTVHTKVKKSVDVLDEKYTSGFFSGGDSYQFDLVNDPYAKSSPDIFWYLQGKVAGLQISEDGINTRLRWRGAHPELFLDEIRATTQELKTIQIDDIAYIKVFRPPFFGSFGSGEGGAIAIYTRKGEDIQYVQGRGMGYTLITGYTKYKEFYSPDYTTNQSVETDTRTTLYWNPYLLTNKDSKSVKVEFYNNDITRRFRVVIEGMNEVGQLARVEKIVE